MALMCLLQPSNKIVSKIEKWSKVDDRLGISVSLAKDIRRMDRQIWRNST